MYPNPADRANSPPRSAASHEANGPAAVMIAVSFSYRSKPPVLGGNKRAAVMTAFVFLDKNVIELTVSPKDLEAVTRRVAAGEMTKNELVRWMQKQIGRVGR